MDKRRFSRPVDLKQIRITDEFWQREQELVRKEVIPYQWEALNDRVDGAAPSYCMHNFRAAGRLVREKKAAGTSFAAPAYTYRGFEVLPEDPAHPDPDRFYGFVFQDTDFSKWIEAVAYTLTWHPDPELEKTADEAIETVCAAQWENGYLDTYYILSGMDRSFTNLKDHHELYCLGHLTEGAVAYYQATGKDRLLKAACRFADYVASVFGPEEGKRRGYPGHEIAEMALVRLYEVTGCEKYLQLAEFFLNQRGTEPHYFIEEEKERWFYEQRNQSGADGEAAAKAENDAAGEPAAKAENDAAGEPAAKAEGGAAGESEAKVESDTASESAAAEKKASRKFPARIRALTAADYAYYQAHQPVREQSEAVGHAVRAGYLYSGMADVARLREDEDMFAACERLWNSIVSEKLYITGGVGGTSHGEAFSYPYDLPNDAAYSETCAAIALAFFARRMLQICPSSRYADVMEQALYNTVLAGMALDGKSFFYVNPLEVTPEACRRDSRLSHVKPVRQKWFGCACCPPNLARIVSSAGAYAYTENEDTLWFHLYMGGQVVKTIGAGDGTDSAGGSLTLQVETGIPWSGNVKVKVCDTETGPVVDGANTSGEVSKDASSSGVSGAAPKGASVCGVFGAVPKNTSACGETSEVSKDTPACGVSGGPVVCTLALRIPGWSGGWHADIVCGGQKQEASRIEDGYLYVTGAWQKGDCISLEFPMDVHVKAANVRVREDLGKAAFVRGPVTYCAEEADNGKDLYRYRADMERICRPAGGACGAAAGERGAMNGMGGSDGNGAASGTSGIRVEMTEQLGYPMAVLKVPAKKLIATKDAAVPDGERPNAAVPAKRLTATEDAAVPDGGFPDAAVSDGECPDAPVPDGGFPNVSGTVGKVPRPASGSLYHDYVPPVEEDAVLTLIPYYAWANRGEGEMTVWIRV